MTDTRDSVGIRSPQAARPFRGQHPQAPTDTTTDSTTGLASGVESATNLVRDSLRAYVAARCTSAAAVAPEYERLWSVLADQVGGKLLRPRLTMAAYLGLGGQDVSAAAPVAAAQELLHTAMLVHDDLLDADEVRRGRPNLTGTYRARLAQDGVLGRVADHQLLAAGLLAGDLALVAAFDLIASAPVPAETRVAAVRMLAMTVSTTVAGELLDISGELRPPLEVDPILVAELKTAAYSCCGPLRAGALLALAPPATVADLDRFGTALGIAYQLVDDHLGVFGDPAQTGKSVLSDLRAGKRTELLRLAYLLADADQRLVLDRHVGDPELDEAGAARVRRVMTRSGASDRVRALAAGTARAARETASRKLPAPLGGYLVSVVDELVEKAG